MPFIPHTKADIDAMLDTIGAHRIDDLFDEIPESLRDHKLQGLPKGLNELALTQNLQATLANDQLGKCFIGAGAYEHHIPAAVWDIASRGEFLTAYTPYQAEASQGTLQLLYEFQTMIASLMGLEVSNASLYDGASALAEAILMAVRCQKNSKTRLVLIPRNLPPAYAEVVKSIVETQDITVCEVPYAADGTVSLANFDHDLSSGVAALVIAQPNFFGGIEAVDTLTDWAHAQGAMVIACVNPVSMALLKEPGQWGKAGADIACGEGQALGIPMASGGPYYGFIACKQAIVRQMPGRIIGRTTDLDGNPGFVLTLQAREQHIRRAKATSNICTNQGLMVTASTVYMSLLGPEGLRRVAGTCHANALQLKSLLAEISGVTVKFSAPFFHEFVISTPMRAEDLCQKMAAHGIQAGYPLGRDFPELTHELLICVTETKTVEDLREYQKVLSGILA